VSGVVEKAAAKDRVKAALVRVRKQLPPWVTSTIVHAILLILLALLVVPSDVGSPPLLDAIISRDVGEQLDEQTVQLDAHDAQVAEDIALAIAALPEVADPRTAPEEFKPAPRALRASSADDAPAIGLAFRGRERGMKQALLAAYGGTGVTESAVAAGLEWLARQQRADGSWSLTGPYQDGAMQENEMAATAMALLAFLGAGHTHLTKDARADGAGSLRDPAVRSRSDRTTDKVVRKGMEVLLGAQDEQGNFFQEGPSQHRLYTQAQATIALCELYGMTRDEKLKEPAQRAVNYCVRVQDNEGGWRYSPGRGSDTSVTGWFLMALKSAQMAYLVVPDDALQAVGRFLDGVADEGGRRYVYRPGSHGGPAMTAEGLLCRQYLGWRQDDPRLREGVNYLLDNPMRWNDRDVYYWYYATQVCHHMEGDPWQRWNEVMRELLPQKQLQDGPERGSWDPAGDRWGPHGGRLYATCLSIYMLEVYYRHLALYRVSGEW
jgi:hypothetical protein